MTNPAHQLHQLLLRWEFPPANSISERRSTDIEGGRGFETENMLAVALLEDVLQSLTWLEKGGGTSTLYAKYFGDWFAAVFQPEHIWSSDAYVQPIPEPALDALEHLGNQLNAHGFGQMPPAAELEALVGTIREFGWELEGASWLPPDVRRYLLALTDQCIGVLTDINRYGVAQARSITFTLGGAIISTTGVVAQTQPSRVRQFAMWARTILRLGAATYATQEVVDGLDVVFSNLTEMGDDWFEGSPSELPSNDG